ncbi:PREDICTED: B3 domain-containing protein REM-like 1 isoform X2 [Camelina sativa]|uniref:B3 domain-containing protein REM-like 1 isoform X1 n=1 Tax=Camelina sativa TaxID=90675 RepID=A0ABM0SWQ2_CAMSA|nr:PREDICTED: B3 domain-containing protein REM-like 1 isoform X1 [Camelina sativa]XP_010417226.1 PREDICTED: B3 domain-containing protein REM-like 1 isoform X2 [Camelina sativa]
MANSLILGSPINPEKDMMIQVSDHQNNNIEFQRKKKVKQNNTETEADCSYFNAHVTASSQQSGRLYLPQDFTSSSGLIRKCSKSPPQIISSSDKNFIKFRLAPVDGRHCRLRLPMQFTRENGINTPGKIYLLGKDGSKWLANLLLENTRGRMTLGDGWKSFVKANGLKTGESVTLRLCWEDTIPVLSLCSEEYITDTRVGKKCSEASEKEPLPTVPETKKDESSSWKRENNHMRCIDSTSPSQNHILTLTITPDSLKHGRLRLPLQFMAENNMDKPGEITLLGKDGAKWLVSLLLEKRGRMSLGKGWKDFAKANGLRTDDSITLELIWENATPILHLLRIESSSGRGECDFSKESLPIEPNSGNKARNSDNNREESKKYPPGSRESSSAIQNQFMALTRPSGIISQGALHLQTNEVFIYRNEGGNMLQISDLGPYFFGIRDVPAPSSNNDHDRIGNISMKMHPHLRKEAGFSSYDGDDHDNFERQSKKRVRKNDPETEENCSSDHTRFGAHVTTTSNLHTNELRLAAKESLPIGPSVEKKISEGENSKDKNNMVESSSCGREENHLRCIASISPSQNRFLTLTITPDSLRHGRLRLPLDFMTENNMNKPGEITLLGKNGAKWLVSLLLERRGRMSLGKGWKNFAKENGLKTGDSITFESIGLNASHVLSLLYIESSSVRGQSEFPKESHLTNREERNSRELEKRTYCPSIQNSSSDIQNRFLTLTLTPEDVRDGTLHLPSKFMRINGINKPGQITLLGRGGMKWFAYLLPRDGTVVLGNGWKGFCEANGVMLGDSFILEFIPKEDTNHVFNFYSI